MLAGPVYLIGGIASLIILIVVDAHVDWTRLKDSLGTQYEQIREKLGTRSQHRPRSDTSSRTRPPTDTCPECGRTMQAKDLEDHRQAQHGNRDSQKDTVSVNRREQGSVKAEVLDGDYELDRDIDDDDGVEIHEPDDWTDPQTLGYRRFARAVIDKMENGRIKVTDQLHVHGHRGGAIIPRFKESVKRLHDVSIDDFEIKSNVGKGTDDVIIDTRA